jgi:hypothetical protein
LIVIKAARSPAKETDPRCGDASGPRPKIQIAWREVMSTGLDTFDRTVRETNLWTKSLMDELETGEVAKVVRFLPPEIRELWPRVARSD